MVTKMLFLLAPLFGFFAIAWLRIRAHRLRGRQSPVNEPLLKEPAHSLRVKHINQALDSFIYLAGATIFPMLMYIAYLHAGGRPWIYVIVGAAATGVCVVLAFRNWSSALVLLQGIDAETAAGQELNYLMRDGAWVFHDLEYPYGNIDHVIVSQGGVFAVETKGAGKSRAKASASKSGWTAKVDNGKLIFPSGTTRQPLEQAKRHAKWIATELQRRFHLDIPVRPVVALPGWWIENSWEDECWVINPKRGNALRTAVTKPVLPDQHVAMIASWLEDKSRCVEPKSRELDSVT